MLQSQNGKISSAEIVRRALKQLRDDDEFTIISLAKKLDVKPKAISNAITGMPAFGALTKIPGVKKPGNLGVAPVTYKVGGSNTIKGYYLKFPKGAIHVMQRASPSAQAKTKKKPYVAPEDQNNRVTLTGTRKTLAQVAIGERITEFQGEIDVLLEKVAALSLAKSLL